MTTRIMGSTRATRVAIALTVAGMALVRGAAAQQQPSFEVASVKRNNSADPGIRRGMQPGGMTFTNHTARQLIIAAYGLQPFQVLGGPDWLNDDRFDVTARAEGAPPPEQMNLMLRSLLAARFKLVAHTEQRDLPNYTLVRARDDGQPGPGLKPAAVDCGPTGRGRGGPPPAPAAGGRAGGGPGAPGGCGAMIAPGRIIAGGQPLSLLTTILSNQVGRPVIDKTGLTGSYDLELSFLPDGGRAGGPVGPPPPGAPPLPPIDPDAPSLFTALQEQLGLKLESGRGPVDVLVIDSVEPPTED